MISMRHAVPGFLVALVFSSCAARNPTSYPATSLYPPTSPLDAVWSGSGAARSGRLARVCSLPAGQSVVVGEIEGPAVIRHLWITAQSPVPSLYGLLVLRIWWDNESEPSVECPLGDFFGVGFGKEREFVSAMSDMVPAGGENHAALNCYWPMPFARRARIEIENRGRRAVSMFFLQADYEAGAAMGSNAMYFHAQFRRENPVQRGRPYTILDATGRGAYVGTVLDYHLLGPGAWVEGGNDVYIDDAETPSLPAVGGEDYFGHAWGFRTEVRAPFHGTSYGPEDNRMTAYRWHVPDPTFFGKSIRVTMRDHGWDVGDRQDDYASVAFWYQVEPHAPFPPLPVVNYEYLQIPEQFWLSPAELFAPERLPPPPPGGNLIPERKAWKASGRYDANSTGDRAFDGRLDTKWCDASIPDGEWLAVDFGTTRTLTGCVVKNAETAGEPAGFNTKTFRVESGPALAGPWNAIASVDNTKGSSSPDLGAAVATVVFERPVRARCIRLVIRDAGYLDPIVRIPEFEVYGNP